MATTYGVLLNGVLFRGVLLRGTDSWLLIERRGFFGSRRRCVEELHGFYTTRFVEAAYAELVDVQRNSAERCHGVDDEEGALDEASERAEAPVADELRAVVVNGARPFGITVEGSLRLS